MFFDIKKELAVHMNKVGLKKSLDACHACHKAREVLKDELESLNANITKFQQGKIFIKCNNGIARHELFFNKYTYTQRLKEAITEYQIDEIVIC